MGRSLFQYSELPNLENQFELLICAIVVSVSQTGLFGHIDCTLNHHDYMVKLVVGIWLEKFNFRTFDYCVKY